MWLIIVAAGSIIHSYFSLESILLIEEPAYRTVSIVFLTIEAYILLQLFLINYFLIKSKGIEFSKDNTKYEVPTKDQISILVPTKNPNLDDLKRTLQAIIQLNYPKDLMEIWVGDDTTTTLQSKVEYLCREYGVNYYHSGTQKQFKAGMLNILLKKISSKYFIVLDYDQAPHPDLVKRLLGEFLSQNDPKLSFVQAIKRFRNIKSLSGFFSSILYLQYFEVVQRPKNSRGTVLFAGSTAMFRTDIVRQIGGFSVKSITEDTETAIQLILEGYHGRFINFIGSWGSVPNSYRDQVSQIWRWTMGGSQSLRLNFIRILKSKNLTISQKIDLVSTLGITFIIPFIFIYGLTVWILTLGSLDTPRLGFYVGGFLISSQIIIPTFGLLTYLVILSLAIRYAREETDQGDDYSWKLVLPMTMIGISTSVLIVPASVMGFLRIEHPESGNAKWNRNVRLFRNSFLFGLVGIILLFQGINLMSEQFYAGTLVLIEGLIFLHPLAVTTLLWITKN